MVGTSGTVTTLTGVFLNLPRYDRGRVDGRELEFGQLEGARDTLAGARSAKTGRRNPASEIAAGGSGDRRLLRYPGCDL